MQTLTKSLSALSSLHLERLALLESTGFNLGTFAEAAKISTLNALKFIDEPEVQAALNEYDRAFDTVFTRAQKHAHLIALKSLSEALIETTDPVERRRIANLLLRFTAAKIKSLSAPTPPADADQNHTSTQSANHIHLPTIPALVPSSTQAAFFPADPVSSLLANPAAKLAASAGNINSKAAASKP